MGAFITTCHKLCVGMIIMCVGRCGNTGMFEHCCMSCILYDFVTVLQAHNFSMGKNGYTV